MNKESRLQKGKVTLPGSYTVIEQGLDSILCVLVHQELYIKEPVAVSLSTDGMLHKRALNLHALNSSSLQNWYFFVWSFDAGCIPWSGSSGLLPFFPLQLRAALLSWGKEGITHSAQLIFRVSVPYPALNVYMRRAANMVPSLKKQSGGENKA